jgi:hypothetical protein
MVSTVQDRGYVSKETREGVERAYQKIEIIEGAISESTPVESTLVEGLVKVFDHALPWDILRGNGVKIRL